MVSSTPKLAMIFMVELTHKNITYTGNKMKRKTLHLPKRPPYPNEPYKQCGILEKSNTQLKPFRGKS